MDRRQALTGMGGIVAASALLALPRTVFAQSTTVTAPPVSAQPLTAADYKPMTLMAGTASKMQSVMAQTKAVHPLVRQFAVFETDEQTSIAQVLTDMTAPPPAPLDPADQQVIAKLQGTTGKAFDVAYIDAQIQGHRKLLTIQQGFLTGAVTNRDLEHIAVLARTTIMMHLTMLQELQRHATA